MTAETVLGVVEVGRVLERLRKDTPTDGKAVLEEVRKIVVNTNNSYEDILQQCLHTEVIVSTVDPKYKVFETEVAKLLEGKTRDEMIIILTVMIMSF